VLSTKRAISPNISDPFQGKSAALAAAQGCHEGSKGRRGTPHSRLFT